MEIILGKISMVSFGLGGYNNAMLGIHLDFTFQGGGISYTKSVWDKNLIKHYELCNWTEEDRNEKYVDIMRYVSDLLKEAKVDTVDKLKDIPVELTLQDNMLKSWRILGEVL